MGTFAQRGLAASSLDHCGTPVPITCDAAIPPPSVYIGRGTRVLPLRLIPQEPLTRRSPGYLLVVVRLDTVLDPGDVDDRSSSTRPSRGLRQTREDQPIPKIQRFSELCFRFRATPFISPHSLLFPSLFRFSHFTTGRLTRPYPGRLARSMRVPPQHATIARLPLWHDVAVPDG